MPTIKIYLKGWADFNAYRAAVNDPTDPRHERANNVRDVAWQPYKAGQDVYHAITYTEAPGDPLALCERAFTRFNIGDPFDDEIVREYRDARHRSLSVGDVVVVGADAYTVASFGFDPVPDFSPTAP